MYGWQRAIVFWFARPQPLGGGLSAARLRLDAAWRLRRRNTAAGSLLASFASSAKRCGCWRLWRLAQPGPGRAILAAQASWPF